MADAASAAAAAPAIAANVNTPSQPANPAPEVKAEGSGENSEPKVAAPKYFEIDGERVTAEEFKRMKSLASGAHKKFEEAAQMRKEAENVLSQIRDPKKAIKLLEDPKLGLSQDQIIVAMEEWYNERVIEPSKLTPEQLELRAAKERIADFEAKEAEKKKLEETDAEKERDQEDAKRIQTEILEALKTSQLPKTKFVASRLAYWMRVNENKGINAPAALLVEQVRKEARDNMNSMLEASDGDVLVGLLGEETIKKVRKYDMARWRASRGQKTPVATQDRLKSDASSDERISIEEMKRRERDPNLWK